ncbi:MAG: aminoglycoside phosphotransferase family protein [Oscillospiraceae bacterium]|nr:aminoglycoside phosphotransferase family protein [Oscillospiraceae bacterium]
MDTKKDIALKILNDELNIMPMKVTRFPTGFCHSVYYIKTEIDEFVLRVTESKWHYYGSVKWLNELARFEIPIPKILRHGQYGDVYYTLITYIHGKDLGDVYHTLNDFQKRDIVKELVEIQKKVSDIAPVESFVYLPEEHIKTIIQRFRESITANKVFDPSVCDAVADLINKVYFANVKPKAYLDDISTKNVLIHNGKLAGIVDIDEMGYGDPLEVVGLTNMALLLMEADTKYIDYWLDELQATATQRKAVTFYTLLSCISFMGERGTKFNNDTFVTVNHDEVELLNSIYNKLITQLREQVNEWR